MPTINNEIYDHVHPTWWEEDGFMSLLRTAVNPPRFEYFRNVLINRLRMEPNQLRLLDVGCGGGLLSEPFAAQGCQVTGVDRSIPTLAAARAHAQKSGLAIQYLEANAESLPFDDQSFDIVCCCDVLEHVDDMDRVINEISRVLKPGGIFFFDTINRTLRSKLVAIKLAQDWRLTRVMPRDVHVWDKFVRPEELVDMLEKHGMQKCELAGLSPATNPMSAVSALSGLLRNKLGKLSFAELGNKVKLRQSKDLSISYMGYSLRSLRK